MTGRGSLVRQHDSQPASRGSGGSSVHPVEIAAAEETDQHDHHERREKELAPWRKVTRWEKQQSNRRNKGRTCKTGMAPREHGGDKAGAAPHQGEQRYERGGVGGPRPGRPRCDYAGNACCEKCAREQNCSKPLPLGFHMVPFCWVGCRGLTAIEPRPLGLVPLTKYRPHEAAFIADNRAILFLQL